MTDERLKIVKYINDPVYGGIGITQLELDLISTPVFQRLRGLKQVARLNFIFPSAGTFPLCSFHRSFIYYESDDGTAGETGNVRSGRCG